MLLARRRRSPKLLYRGGPGHAAGETSGRDFFLVLHTVEVAGASVQAPKLDSMSTICGHKHVLQTVELALQSAPSRALGPARLQEMKTRHGDAESKLREAAGKRHRDLRALKAPRNWDVSGPTAAHWLKAASKLYSRSLESQTQSIASTDTAGH